MTLGVPRDTSSLRHLNQEPLNAASVFGGVPIIILVSSSISVIAIFYTSLVPSCVIHVLFRLSGDC